MQLIYSGGYRDIFKKSDTNGFVIIFSINEISYVILYRSQRVLPKGHVSSKYYDVKNNEIEFPISY